MHSSLDERELEVPATAVRVTKETLTVELQDGRTLLVPTAWFPRLAHGTEKEWTNTEISPYGVHWPDLDEDISVRGLLLGRKSGEGQDSLKFWLDNRKKGKKVTVMDFLATKRKHKHKAKTKKTA